ncbi:MAG TPA: NAD(P)/FAD-dependent oxidoreductase [Longimicrobium sp.]|nr:NAD(P)/FAD-dependent oxidoreductase [Longimicrobium sp.]
MPGASELLLWHRLRLRELRLRLRRLLWLRRLRLQRLTSTRRPVFPARGEDGAHPSHLREHRGTMQSLDVIVVGAGQAGLAMGYHLSRAGLDVLLLEAGPSVGHAWRTRWDSLKLFTPARYSSLPGLPFPAEPDHYPARDEVAAYLETYASTFGFPVRTGTRVTALRPDPAGGFRVETSTGELHALQVVVATGPFQRPRVPDMAGGLDAGIVQIHGAGYRNPGQLPRGEVLVVGAGNSGVQIAAELAATRPVTLAAGERLTALPETILGRSVFWWLERSGYFNVTADSWMGRRMKEKELLIGHGPDWLARNAGVKLAGRITSARGGELRTADGGRIRPDAIVWATGYRSEYSWIEAPVLGAGGMPVHRRGVTSVPGLYFLGLPWQHTRGSALIGWVGRDAAVLAGHAARHAQPRRRRAMAPAAPLPVSELAARTFALRELAA